MSVFQFVESKLNDSPKKAFAANENKSNGRANEEKCDKYDQLTDDELETSPVKDNGEVGRVTLNQIKLQENECKNTKHINKSNNLDEKILNLYKKIF